jgi:ABC-type bacteriocin/lantibiotic exporter with double-glycine peptidase domain
MLTAALYAQSSPAVWIDVPFVPQPPEGCGAASISMVMQYWEAQPDSHVTAKTDVAAIQRELYSAREHGIPASSMAQYLRQRGFTAIAFSGTWDDLVEQIKKGRPLIAAIRPQGQSQLHYVVIDGVDPQHALVTMNDPAERKLMSQERAGFERDWSATRNWLLLAVPSAAQSR